MFHDSNEHSVKWRVKYKTKICHAILTFTNCSCNTSSLKSRRLLEQGHSNPRARLGSSWGVSAKIPLNSDINFTYTQSIHTLLIAGEASVYTEVFFLKKLNDFSQYDTVNLKTLNYVQELTALKSSLIKQSRQQPD